MVSCRLVATGGAVDGRFFRRYALVVDIFAARGEVGQPTVVRPETRVAVKEATRGAAAEMRARQRIVAERRATRREGNQY